MDGLPHPTKFRKTLPQKHPNNALLVTLLGDSAYATQKYNEAVLHFQRAIELAHASGDDGFASDMAKRLNLYQAGKPYTEASDKAER